MNERTCRTHNLRFARVPIDGGWVTGCRDCVENNREAFDSLAQGIRLMQRMKDRDPKDADSLCAQLDRAAIEHSGDANLMRILCHASERIEELERECEARGVAMVGLGNEITELTAADSQPDEQRKEDRDGR